MVLSKYYANLECLCTVQMVFALVAKRQRKRIFRLETGKVSFQVEMFSNFDTNTNLKIQEIITQFQRTKTNLNFDYSNFQM